MQRSHTKGNSFLEWFVVGDKAWHRHFWTHSKTGRHAMETLSCIPTEFKLQHLLVKGGWWCASTFRIPCFWTLNHITPQSLQIITVKCLKSCILKWTNAQVNSLIASSCCMSVHPRVAHEFRTNWMPNEYSAQTSGTQPGLIAIWFSCLWMSQEIPHRL